LVASSFFAVSLVFFFSHAYGEEGIVRLVFLQQKKGIIIASDGGNCAGGKRRRGEKEKIYKKREGASEQMARVGAAIGVAVVTGVGVAKLLCHLSAIAKKKRLIPRVEFNKQGGITWVESFGDYVGEHFVSSRHLILLLCVVISVSSSSSL
jgi:hypothetical protein